MESKRLPRFKSTRGPEAGPWNAATDVIESLGKTSGNGIIAIDGSPLGRLIRVTQEWPIIAKITTGANPYNWTFAVTPGKMVSTDASDPTTLPIAYEINGVTNVPPGTYVELWPASGTEGKLLFAYQKCAYGSSVTIPGCPCLLPGLVTMTVVRPDANFGMFQNATLAYTTVPPELGLLSLGTKSYISTTTFIDEVTLDSFWYHFFCSGGYFCLSRIYAISVYGSPFSDAIRYRWLGGQPGNTCVPFMLTNGKVFPGGDPTSVVSIAE